jgi:hypothetical protein
METVYDWVTVAIFAGIIVLFMQRSMAEEVERGGDSLWLYLGAGVGCAVANYFGNQGQHIIAVLLIAGTLGFILYFLKPFNSWPKA